MKNKKLILLVSLGSLMAIAAGRGQYVAWQQLNLGIAQFGITSIANGVTNQSPSVFQAGYNGAYTFGGTPNDGFGQTFTVASDRPLASIQLRIGLFNQPGQGQFALSVLEFDPLTQTPGALLGTVIANATNFNYDILSVPVSSFDFSSLGIELQASKTYAWTLNSASADWIGPLTIQSCLASFYPDGVAYSLIPVPEPAAPALAILAGIGFAVLHKGRKSCCLPVTHDSG